MPIRSPFSHGRSEVHQRDDLRARLARERVRIGACLRAHRQRLQLSRDAAAERIGIHVVHLGRIERGSANITLSTLTAIADAYGVSLRQFFSAPPAECACEA